MLLANCGDKGVVFLEEDFKHFYIERE